MPTGQSALCIFAQQGIAEHGNRIKNHIYSTNFLNPNQFGFTQQLSTYHPLLRLTEKISSGFQRGRTTGAVFLDIQRHLTVSG
ncbi:hypothetical protein TNCV_2773321 [Trichonephila clavipes]|nr:hypothetical protein TNCV_2773321 [Trichonephila clavipes]